MPDAHGKIQASAYLSQFKQGYWQFEQVLSELSQNVPDGHREQTTQVGLNAAVIKKYVRLGQLLIQSLL
jgi:hypothetical protein